MASTKKTQQEVSNLSAKMIKISSDTAKCAEAHAKVIKVEASIETEMAKVSDQKLQQDVKIENLMQRVNDLEGKMKAAV